jgi:hypothetical protein
MVGMTAMLVVAATAVRAQADPPPAGDAVQTEDVLLFRTGKLVHGQIIKETDTTVRIMVKIGTMPAVETEYAKEDILKIMHDQPVGKPEPKPVSDDKPVIVSKTNADPGAVRVYVIELNGVFGEDISQTPIRDAIEDARKQGAEYIILEMNNDWSKALTGGLEEQDLPDDVHQFDQLWRAEDMDKVFTDEIPTEWERQPKIVFWVKNAMGGAAFLPLICHDIYFSSEARMGGIGNLAKMMSGHQRVIEKQISLRLGHAAGMAITGGYDPRIIKAMARYEYQLWMRTVGGKVVLIEDPGEVLPGDVLLTDDGQGDNEDNIQQLARGLGNDVLTLNAKLAYDLGISKGTVDTLDDLIYELGIERNYTIVKGRSEQIMKGWSSDLARAKKQLRELWQEYNEIQVTGDYRERTQARGKKLRIIKRMQILLKKYEFEGAIRPRWIGLPDFATLNIFKEQIKLEQMRDKK